MAQQPQAGALPQQMALVPQHMPGVPQEPLGGALQQPMVGAVPQQAAGQPPASAVGGDGPCGRNSVLIPARGTAGKPFCIDMYEHPNEQVAVPLAFSPHSLTHTQQPHVVPK